MTAFPWIKSYPQGVHWDDKLSMTSVQQILDDTATRWPDKPALDFMGKRMSYRDLLAQVNRAARGFQNIGVKPGVHVGLYLPNTPHYVISFFGILKAGGTVVNYSPLDAEKVLQHKIADSETDIIVTLDMVMLYPQIAKFLDGTRLQKIIVGNVGEMSPDPEAVNGSMRRADLTCTVPANDRHLSFSQLLDNDGIYEPYSVKHPAETLAVLQYTGGTTGLPKGAMLTHGNLSVVVAQYWATMTGDPRIVDEGRERVLAVLPLFHIYSLAVNLLFGIRLGAEIILHVKFDLETVVKELAAKRVTIFPAVPTMYTAIINYPEIGNYDLSSLKFCSSGGAPLPVEVNQSFQRITGCCLVEGWGMTEASPAGTFTPVIGLQKVGSCGMPIVGVDMKFASVDDPSRYVAQGERGEICIKGLNVMKGYWKNPAATAESMTSDGYFRTGDVGYMDEDGFVYIVDRTKDMLLCSGYNVYPRIIEEAIYEHPSAAEVIVIGIDDPYRGQSPKAFITLKKGAVPFSLEQLQSFLKPRIGKHEMVQAMEIRDALPHTPVGKLSKKELHEEEAAKQKPAQEPDR